MLTIEGAELVSFGSQQEFCKLSDEGKFNMALQFDDSFLGKSDGRGAGQGTGLEFNGGLGELQQPLTDELDIADFEEISTDCPDEQLRFGFVGPHIGGGGIQVDKGLFDPEGHLHEKGVFWQSCLWIGG